MASRERDDSCCNKAGHGRWWLAAAALITLAVVLWSWLQSGPRDIDASGNAPAAASTDDLIATSQMTAAAGTQPAPPALLTGREALHRALGEKAVRVDSDLVIEGIDTDRPWVCAGEPIGLSARVAAGASADAVYRWVWPAAGGEAALHPGQTMAWQAPEAAGTYQVHFQACKDLGGRNVGVLAERVIDIDVRACGAGQEQAHDPLRIRVEQRGQGAFSFHAEYQGDEPVSTYAWDFGDGNAETTSADAVAHAFSTQELGPQQVGRFAVRLEARLAGGARLQATTFVMVRGRPPTHDPPAMDLAISRWRPRADGNGWQSELTVRNPGSTGVTWDRIERVTKRFDGSADIDTLAWRDVIALDEELAGGGFRGRVLVDAAAVPPEVKQIIDHLYGQDADGNEVMVSWTPFKRPAVPRPVDEQRQPPRK